MTPTAVILGNSVDPGCRNRDPDRSGPRHWSMTTAGQFMLPMNDWWSEQWLSRYPRATDNPEDGVYRMSRAKALKRRLIEANPDVQSNVLVTDGDDPDSALRALSAIGNHPMPNAIMENRKNGHAHAAWILETPVTRTEYAHRKPLLYAAAVSEGLRRAVNGDRGYAGVLMKNPVHPDWDTHWMRAEPYTLAELDAGLRPHGHMPSPTWRKRKDYVPQGLGRNCDAFEIVRRWAYREVRKFFGDPEGLGNAILARTAELNSTFAEPLPESEVLSIASSITRWIVTRSNLWRDGAVVYEANFVAMQSARSRKGHEARWAGKAGELREDLRLWGD